MTDLVYLPARKLSRLLGNRKISSVELVRAFIAQVERVNPKVNAIVTFLPEEALKEAKRIDQQLFEFVATFPLAGRPAGR